MKNISLVIALGFALLVSAQSRTLVQTLEKAQATPPASDNLITQATQKRTAAPLIATPQDAKKAIQEGTLDQIASKASSSLRTYPSSPQVRNIRNPRIRSILERGRKLLVAGKAAKGWNATRLSGFASQVDQYLKEAEAAVKSAKPRGETTPTEDCGRAKDRCNQGCHDRDAGYFCFFDCRLEYMVCLAGTIVKRFGSSTIARVGFMTDGPGYRAVQQIHSGGVTP